MNCAEAKRLLPLVRQGELSEAEERLLAVHLRSCASCAAERASYLDQARNLEKLRAITPELADPDASLKAILDRVRKEARPTRQGSLSSFADRLIRALEVPGLRYALAAFVTITVTGFLFQQVTILRSVSALEARLARPGTPSLHMAYAVDPKAVEHLPRSAELRALLERGGDGHQAARLTSTRVGTGRDLLASPEARWVLRTLFPGSDRPVIDSLVAEFSRNVRYVLTTSKGDELQ